MTTSDTILQNLHEIKKQRSHLRIRLNVIRTIKRRTYSHTEGKEFFDEEEMQSWERVLENLDEIDANFSDYVDHLDVELKKLSKGVRQAAKLTDTAGITALEEYIKEDASITVRNLRKARKDFDEAIEVVKQLKDMEIGEPEEEE